MPASTISISKLSPATRSSWIIGGMFAVFIFLAVVGVSWKARQIRQERDQTKAVNSQAGSGEMVWIPAGKMTMGATNGAADERPIRDVKVRGFWMDRTEVTNEQFARFSAATGYVTLAERTGADGAPIGGKVFVMDESGARWEQRSQANWRQPEGASSHIEGREKFPVVQVAWEDAKAFAEWAGKRLPTEAEWEYAARGGAMHQPFVWGREARPGGRWPANTWQGPLSATLDPADGFVRQAPVGSFRLNDYALADMAGNVAEWTADWYRADYYVKGPRKDPAGPAESFDPAEPGVPKRVVRGGSYLSSETNGAGYRPSARGKEPPDRAASDLGFRCVRSVK